MEAGQMTRQGASAGHSSAMAQSSNAVAALSRPALRVSPCGPVAASTRLRSEEHTSELQSLMRISYAVFCLKKKKNKKIESSNTTTTTNLTTVSRQLQWRIK